MGVSFKGFITRNVTPTHEFFRHNGDINNPPSLGPEEPHCLEWRGKTAQSTKATHRWAIWTLVSVDGRGAPSSPVLPSGLSRRHGVRLDQTSAWHAGEPLHRRAAVRRYWRSPGHPIPIPIPMSCHAALRRSPPLLSTRHTHTPLDPDLNPWAQRILAGRTKKG